MLDLLRRRSETTDFSTRLAAPVAKPLPPRIRPRQLASADSAKNLWQQLRTNGPATEADEAAIADPASLALAPAYGRNIESFIGTVKMPVGVVGPLRINGINAHGDYYVPLATTEAALVASYGRGAEVTAQAGGITSAMIGEGVLRTPAFIFRNMLEAGMFIYGATLAAKSFGLDTCPQQAFTKYHRVVRRHLGIPEEEILICGMSLGHIDPGAKANELHPGRVPVSEISRFAGF